MTRTHEKVRYTPKGEPYTPISAAQAVEDALKVLEGRWKLIIFFISSAAKCCASPTSNGRSRQYRKKCLSNNFGKWKLMAWCAALSISKFHQRWNIAQRSGDRLCAQRWTAC